MHISQLPTLPYNGASVVWARPGSGRGVRPMGHGVNIVTLSEETESNRENKPASKVTKAHIYSTELPTPFMALPAFARPGIAENLRSTRTGTSPESIPYGHFSPDAGCSRSPVHKKFIFLSSSCHWAKHVVSLQSVHRTGRNP